MQAVVAPHDRRCPGAGGVDLLADLDRVVLRGPSRFGTDKAVEVSPDGRYELVTQSFSDGVEPCCRVLLRERDGLFSRQTLVWERIEGNCPVRVYFPDNNTISITEWKGGAPMTTAFDRDRLEVGQTLPPKAR